MILNPCLDLAGSLRPISAVGSPPLEPDDSFASDFAPLPASTDSSCVGVDGLAQSPGGEWTGTDRAGVSSVSTRISSGQVDSLDDMASKTQDMPLMMKLEQVILFVIWKCLCHGGNRQLLYRYHTFLFEYSLILAC